MICCCILLAVESEIAKNEKNPLINLAAMSDHPVFQVIKKLSLLVKMTDNKNTEQSLVRFVHSGFFYYTSSSPLLFRGAPDYSVDTVSELTCRSARQLRVKDFPKVSTWWLKWDSNLRPSGRKAPNLPLSHQVDR